MKQVYAPANSAEAHMLAHLLEQNGIRAHIHGEALQGGVGELPAGGLLQLLAADNDYDRARALIIDWEQTNAGNPAETREKQSVPIWIGLLVLTIGVGGGWLLRTAALNGSIPIDATETRLDRNGDGRDDLTYFFRVGAPYAYRAETDRNFDGATDATDYYDSEGIIIRFESDDNFDGFVESTTAYSAGNPIRTETDLNRNSLVDIQIHYQRGVISYEEIRDNRTGHIARVNHFVNMRLVRSESDLNGDGFLETTRTYDALSEVTRTETRSRR
ncbi:MAG TPA: hypothetical protein DHW63_07410 [Hyphomonadaceae bacterium]|nr:hypothetical protein [Hyphomonadaceae bacterium]